MKVLLLVLVPGLAAGLAAQPHPLFALALSNTPKSVKKVLRNEADLETVDAKNLLNALPLRPADIKRAGAAMARADACVFREAVLDDRATESVVSWASRRMLSATTGAAATELDSVDGAPAHQVDVPVETLEALVGREAYEALLAPAAELIGRRPRSATAFVRKYSAKTRVEIKLFKIRSTGPTQ